MKNSYVSDLRDGARVDDFFLICSKSLGHTQDGSPYVRLKLGDRTGTIDAIKWDASETMYSGLSGDDFVWVRGTVTTYNEKLQIKIDSFRRYTDKADPADFLPRSERDIDEMLSEMLAIVASVRHPHLRELLDSFFGDQELLSKFSTAPAAQKIHHGYIGGLLEHSLSVAKMSDLAASHYPRVDRDLLVTGAILHDIGKIEEFCWDKSIKYSNTGHLVGHIVTGALMVEKAAERINGFHPLLKLTLMHMILAHHGQKDWGSPKRPKSIESLVLHYIEDLDAKVNTFQQAVGGPEAGDEADLFTDRHWLFERPLFRGLPRSVMRPWDDEPEPSEPSEADHDPFAEE
jgi:3'-5' exoribonuclease